MPDRHQDDGTITIASTDGGKAAPPRSRIDDITAEVEVGKVYEGPIIQDLLDFGACDQSAAGSDGLLHISQIAHQRVKVTDFLEGKARSCKVKVMETDERARQAVHEGADRPQRSAVKGAPAALSLRTDGLLDEK